ncbi:YidC/Oxa1 family membrane protein insertase [Patescibacteria group bacterium]
MSSIINFFNLILYQPLFNALVLLYLYLPGQDFGVAVIVLTLIIRFLLYPLMAQSLRSQKTMSALQPKIQEIQQRCKGDKAKQSKEMMELYKKEKFNPFSGCFPILLQLPILIAIYQVFWRGFQMENMTQWLYNFVPNPGIINQTFLGIIDLSKGATTQVDEKTIYLIPNIVLILLAGVSQFIQSKMMVSSNPASKNKSGQMGQFSQVMQKQMLYFLPFFTVIILWRLPSAIGLYWIVTTLFSIAQQYLIFKKPKKCLDEIQKDVVTK